MFENVRGLMYRNKPYLDAILAELQAMHYVVEYRLLRAGSIPSISWRRACTRFRKVRTKWLKPVSENAAGNLWTCCLNASGRY